jgi:hypothetical protein
VNQNLKLTTAAFVIFISAAACQQTVSNNSTANNTIINTTSKASNSAANTDTAIVSANSPTAAYIAAYNARKNKDIPALRALLSKDIIEFFKIMGEEDKKSVDDMLKELADRPQAATAEARNEKINGDKATIEYLDEDGKWTPMDLVKEDGVWKLTLAVGDRQDEVRSNSNK